MSEGDKLGFLCYFDELEAPGSDRKKLYPLTEILFVVIYASICGAQSWRDFVTFAVENSLHWILGATLREDDLRVRKEHAPENMTMARVNQLLI